MSSSDGELETLEEAGITVTSKSSKSKLVDTIINSAINSTVYIGYIVFVVVMSMNTEIPLPCHKILTRSYTIDPKSSFESFNITLVLDNIKTTEDFVDLTMTLNRRVTGQTAELTFGMGFDLEIDCGRPINYSTRGLKKTMFNFNKTSEASDPLVVYHMKNREISNISAHFTYKLGTALIKSIDFKLECDLVPPFFMADNYTSFLTMFGVYAFAMKSISSKFVIHLPEIVVGLASIFAFDPISFWQSKTPSVVWFILCTFVFRYYSVYTLYPRSSRILIFGYIILFLQSMLEFYILKGSPNIITNGFNSNLENHQACIECIFSLMTLFLFVFSKGKNSPYLVSVRIVMYISCIFTIVAFADSIVVKKEKLLLGVMFITEMYLIGPILLMLHTNEAVQNEDGLDGMRKLKERATDETDELINSNFEVDVSDQNQSQVN